ncbi:hypothetical protein PVAND_003090 [Polypedilum vanderplanki]|uniref:Uncharacterized protein n=1 Tax=Polypedilum vanderplanki TaxID=319348 RepID=A0A9J6BU30_POLVA|nr:hypothetical protein PVAND_003090 [Polypedilum vanderplanki]
MSIDENAFADCRDLEYLLLQSNRLREIHENAFSENLQLSILDLSNNQLIRLPGNLFRNQINLYFLQLASNQLQELPSDIFNQLSELGMLNLDSNQLQDLPEGIFDNLPNLYYLSFSFNQIVKLRENLIDKLYSIQNFLAPFNQIIYIPRNFFDGNPYLSSIIISGNNLTILELNPIPMLSDFWFEHNQINAIDERIFNNVTLRSLNGGPNPCADRNGIISNPTNDDIRAALHRCFDNFNPIETTTTPGEEITKPTTEPNGCEVGNIEERICQLEAENAELRARLEYLEKIVLGR